MITQSKLKELLHYNPETGIFVNLKTRGGAIKGSKAGCLHINGYHQIKISGVCYTAHRLAWLYMTGEWPENQIDHINHIRNDNKWANLRDATAKENSRNRTLSPNSTSGVCGVSWINKSKKWQSKIRVNSKHIYIGSYADKFEAICARKSAENKHGFHENHGMN